MSPFVCTPTTPLDFCENKGRPMWNHVNIWFLISLYFILFEWVGDFMDFFLGLSPFALFVLWYSSYDVLVIFVIQFSWISHLSIMFACPYLRLFKLITCFRWLNWIKFIFQQSYHFSIYEVWLINEILMDSDKLSKCLLLW